MSASTPSAAPVFAALGDETRLRLVARLGTDGPLSIAQLTTGTDVTRQGITKHLRVLADAGVLRSTRRGRERLWQLEPRPLEDAQQFLHRLSAEWDQSLARLKASLEE